MSVWTALSNTGGILGIVMMVATFIVKGIQNNLFYSSLVSDKFLYFKNQKKN